MTKNALDHTLAEGDKLFQIMKIAANQFLFVTERGRIFDYMPTGEDSGMVREHGLTDWSDKTAEAERARVARLIMEAQAAQGRAAPPKAPKKKSSLILAETPELVVAETEGSPESAE